LNVLPNAFGRRTLTAACLVPGSDDAFVSRRRTGVSGCGGVFGGSRYHHTRAGERGLGGHPRPDRGARARHPLNPRVLRQHDRSGRLARGDVRNLTVFGGRTNAEPARVYGPDLSAVAGWQRLSAFVSPWQEGTYVPER